MLVTWNEAAESDDIQWWSVTYGNGKFVAIANSGNNRVMWSLTGTGEDSTTLTFANGTDMSALEAGDAVSQASSTDPVPKH